MAAAPNSLARDHLVSALQAELVGPFALKDDAVETLPISPLSYYLAGFLAPEDSPTLDTIDPSENDDDVGAGDDEDDPEQGGAETVSKAPKRLPASIGLTVLLPPSQAGTPQAVTTRLHWADYRAQPVPKDPEHPAKKGRPGVVWVRVPAAPVVRELPLDAAALADGWEVAPGLWLKGHLVEAKAPGLQPGTQALSLFVINRRAGATADTGDGLRLAERCAFQVRLEVSRAAGLAPRPNRRDEGSPDLDAGILDLQFRDRCEWAVGHGVAVEPLAEAGRVLGARTTFLPTAEVPRVEARRLDGVQTDMEQLATLADGEAVRKALSGIVDAYAAWIAEQRRVDVGSTPRREIQEVLLTRAEEACRRIGAGIDLLASDAQMLCAFRLANHAMAQAARKRSPERYHEDKTPAWRMFQLAFVLLNLPGIASAGHDDRELVELIFFPTGGGKTEAYLGVIACTLLLRRLRGSSRPDGGLGVAVVLRYTLRLLTLDQLGRAATLICALERLRQERKERDLGPERFAIGLWVGRSATANTLTQVEQEIRDFRLGRTKNSPFPLPACPWCGDEIRPSGLTLDTKLGEVRVTCGQPSCDFSGGRNPDGLPVLFVDEHIYQELPCFLVATVDKFAMLPWRGRTGMLFGRVHSRNRRTFYGPMDSERPSTKNTKLPDGLVPPELIVQDELHLITGPLGTMVGLYETAVETLCVRRGPDGTPQRPKIIASTATVRRAEQQVQAIFGRPRLCMFPPQGIDDGDSFFAKVDDKTPGRKYIGIAAAGRSMKAALIRTYVTLLGAAEWQWKRADSADDKKRADAYMTLVGYFNALRELGGMRRLLEDEIRVRSALPETERAPRDHVGPHPWTQRRLIKYEPTELTSRESTANIAGAKKRLERPHDHPDHVDVALASNMISVGVDIDRLGLMVVAGQPKTTSEYIQASSRVGRSPEERPGLVVTVLNLFKPRDRSHYERFLAYHQCFYRNVEANSVTPFSAPALERGLAGLLVTMARLGTEALTPAEAVSKLSAYKAAAERAVAVIAERAAGERASYSEAEANRIRESVRRLGENLIEAWATLGRGDGTDTVRRYSGLEEGKPQPALLFTALDPNAPPPTTEWGKFKAPTSMRDVEASVHMWKDRYLTTMEDSDGGHGTR